MSPIHPLFQSQHGCCAPFQGEERAEARAADALLDAALLDAALLDAALAGFGPGARIRSLRAAGEPRRVLVILPASPVEPAVFQPFIRTLERSGHDVRTILDTRRGVWRSTKINEAVARCAGAAAAIDWVVVIDEDVALDPDFLDRFLSHAEAARLVLAQPAHRLHSHASYEVNRRRPRSLVRLSNFVEIGPIVALHGSVLWKLAPLPETLGGWGVDFLWAQWACRLGWRIGIVDATPIEHLRPVTYRAENVPEACALLFRHHVSMTREEMLTGDRVEIGW